ncbi:MAG: DUF6602 domain-containing protein [Candidatus Scalinduaceae bacterium]
MELESLKDRVRHYINDRHWLSDGEWKESVIRTMLRRHFPTSIGIGSGFIVSEGKPSTQIDILLYDNSKPVLFQEGNFVILTPDAVRGVIEVKTKLYQNEDFNSAIKKLCKIAELINPFSTYALDRFIGLFSYEESGFNTTEILSTLQKNCDGHKHKIINCVSLGQNYFVRFWPSDPNSKAGMQDYHKWHEYYLKTMAPAYFIHNAIDHLFPQWTNKNNDIWYPENGKESYKTGEIFLYRDEQIV